MLKKRVIPVVLLREGYVVQSKNFSRFKIIGNPSTVIKRLSDWGADELIFLDISIDNYFDLGRDEHAIKNCPDFLSIIKRIAGVSNIPTTIGGKVKSIKDFEARIEAGADKVSVNSLLVDSPKTVRDASDIYGSQAVVASIDFRRMDDGNYYPFSHKGMNLVEKKLLDFVKYVHELNVGEILLHNIGLDGALTGYDIDIIKEVEEICSVPLIVCGGAGNCDHFQQVFKRTNVSAVAAANIFNYVDQSVYLAKLKLYKEGFPVRKPTLLEEGYAELC